MAVADLNGVLDNIKNLFDNANSTAASYDLSSNMQNRVKKVLTVNPDFIPPQASYFPFVTSYITSKSIESDNIVPSQQSSLRKSELQIEIVGGVYNQKITDSTKDLGDRDINYLMENIEYILRTDYNLGGKIKWQKPIDVSYYSLNTSKSHIRVGVLKLQAVLFY